MKPPTVIAAHVYRKSPRLVVLEGVSVCVRGKGKRGGGGVRSCDPTALRPASQAGETQAHVGAPLTAYAPRAG